MLFQLIKFSSSSKYSESGLSLTAECESSFEKEFFLLKIKRKREKLSLIANQAFDNFETIYRVLRFNFLNY